MGISLFKSAKEISIKIICQSSKAAKGAIIVSLKMSYNVKLKNKVNRKIESF